MRHTLLTLVVLGGFSIPLLAQGNSLRVESVPSWDRVEWEATRIVSVSPSGTLAVGQAGDARVFFLSSGAAAPLPVGRRGGGPGEFQMLGPLGWVADTLWVQDRAEISFFTREGKFLRRAAIPPISTPAEDAAGTRVLGIAVWAVAPSGATLRRGSTREGAFGAVWVNAAGEILHRAAWFPAPKCPGDSDPSGIRMPFCDKPVLAVSPSGGLVATSTTVGRRGSRLTVAVEVRDHLGKSLWRRELDLPEIAVTRKFADSIRNVIAGYRGTPPELAARIRAAEMARYLPPVLGLIVDRDGGVWFQTRTGEWSSRWLRFDTRGTPLGEAPSPLRLTLLTAQGATAWGVERDEDDVPRVVRVVWQPK